MHAFTRFPSHAGQNPWFELSQYKDHKFDDIKDLKKNYDFVIVGAGFGGVMAAFRIVENDPSASVAIFDSLPVGMYSSGRNAGFVSSALILKALVGWAHFTLDDQKWLLKFNRAIVDKFNKMREQYKLNFEWRHDGMYKAVRERSNQKQLEPLARYFDKLGINYKWYEGDELSEKLGTEFYRKALFTDENYLDNPSEFIRGLATALPQNVQVFENQSVLEVKDGPHPEVLLPGGQVIKAGKVFLTCNEFIKESGISGVNNLCAIHSFGAMSRELTDDEMEIFKGVQPWGVTGIHPCASTVRYTPRRRVFVRTDIAFATHPNVSPERIHKALKLLRPAFEKRFPTLKEVPFEYVYGGLICFTGNDRPLFGEFAKNVYAISTGDGSGVTRMASLGLYLADYAQGKDSEELRYILKHYHPSYIPGEPVRTIGATLNIAWKNFQAGSEV